jgi:hypothetical protein
MYKNIISLVGITTDNKALIDGVWKAHDTYGIPLEILFEVCVKNNWMPDWMLLHQQMLFSGIQHSRVISILEHPLTDAFGFEFATTVLYKLNLIYKVVVLKRLLKIIRKNYEIHKAKR